MSSTWRKRFRFQRHCWATKLRWRETKKQILMELISPAIFLRIMRLRNHAKSAYTRIDACAHMITMCANVSRHEWRFVSNLKVRGRDCPALTLSSLPAVTSPDWESIDANFISNRGLTSGTKKLKCMAESPKILREGVKKSDFGTQFQAVYSIYYPHDLYSWTFFSPQ